MLLERSPPHIGQSAETEGTRARAPRMLSVLRKTADFMADSESEKFGALAKSLLRTTTSAT